MKITCDFCLRSFNKSISRIKKCVHNFCSVNCRIHYSLYEKFKRGSAPK